MNNLKKELFGTTLPTKKTDDHAVNMADVSSPFEWKDAVMFQFCKGCGTLLEMDLAGVSHLERLAKIKVTPPYSKFYFEVSGCVVCQKEGTITASLLPVE